MRTEELKAIVDAWGNEDKDRAVIVIASERLEGSKTEGTTIMKGEKKIFYWHCSTLWCKRLI